MSSHGRAIRIFLADGTPGGVRTVEVGNWTIKAVVAPRAQLARLRDRPEAGRPGTYLLLGDDPDQPGRLRVYVGESEDAVARQDAHARQKDFWDTVIVFVSTDDRLSKGHVRWLEAELLGKVREAKRAAIENGNAGSEVRPLPEAERAEMAEFLEQMILIAEVLGVDVFPVSSWKSAGRGPTPTSPMGAPPSRPPVEPEVFHVEGREYRASMRITDQGYVVQAGSTAVAELRSSVQPGYTALRERLMADGILVPDAPGLLKFAADFPFKSSTAAVTVVTGTNRSGRATWKLADGRTVGDWEDTPSNADIATT